jgi:hypothetical protein
MTSIRPRTTVVALLTLAAILSACSSTPTSPLNDEAVSADTDTTKRTPTIPWVSVRSVTPVGGH